MEKIEYADINKFLVSTGLVLVSASLIIPYFFLKESFGLYTDKAVVGTFTNEMQNHFYLKQWFILKVNRTLPWISGTVLLTGILFMAWGLKRWFARQTKIDRNFDLATEKLEKEISNMTPVRVVEKATEEVRESELVDSGIDLSTTPNQPSPEANRIVAYLQIEERVFERLKNTVPSNYEVLQHKVLAQDREIDVLLRDKTGKKHDFVIEIKYVNRIISYTSLKKAIERLEPVISHYYEWNPGPSAIPCLIVVYGNDAINADQILNVKNQLDSRISLSPLLKEARIIFVHEEDIDSLDTSLIYKYQKINGPKKT